MDFKVIFSPTSIRDLADSVSYIARHDTEAAARLGDAMIDAAEEILSRHPYAGPPMSGIQHGGDSLSASPEIPDCL
jgi:plasmid stabilization system protein ParE